MLSIILRSYFDTELVELSSELSAGMPVSSNLVPVACSNDCSLTVVILANPPAPA